MMFTVIYGLYILSAPKATRKRDRLPGALLAASALVGVSAVFSRMISESAKYAMVYGSLASVIILMTWIYMCCVIIVTGNVFNISLIRAKEKNGFSKTN
jgi:membrane protein